MGVRGWVAAALVGALGGGTSARAELWSESKQQRVHRQRSDIAKVARRAMPAVVSITTLQETEDTSEGHAEPQKGLGSGFLIHPEGYVLTSAHVIEDATRIDITLDGPGGRTETYRAQRVGEDVATDIALLKIDAARKLPVLRLASARKVEVADWIVVIGNPFGLSHSVTVGVVSFKGRTDVAPNGRGGYFDYLQTDASINPGNSGGPILDLDGEVVAIANAVNVAGQGIGFAIPIDIAKQVLPQLKENGEVRRGWMGASVQDLTPELARAFGESGGAGVIVSDVTSGGPAADAGLKVGDVIVGLGKDPVARAQALRWRVATQGVGQQVRLDVRREGRPMQVKVRLAELPLEARPVRTSNVEQASASLDLGATVSDVDLPASHRAGLAAPFGALIRTVAPDSAMSDAGLKDGDVVLKVNSREISTMRELVSALSEVPSGDPVRLFVRRGQRTVPFTLRKP